MDIPPFQAALAISIIVLIFVIFRLYEAIKMLNARVTLLSAQLRQIRASVKDATSEEMHDAQNPYDQTEDMLQRKMRRDFSYQNKPLEALLNYQSDWARGPKSAAPEGDKPKKAAGDIRGVTLKPEMKQMLQAVRELQAAAGPERRGPSDESGSSQGKGATPSAESSGPGARGGSSRP